MRKGTKILAKIIAATTLVVIFFLLTASLLLQLEAVQSTLASGATRLVSERLGVRVQIERLRIGFFNRVEVEGFYVEDFDRDTLIYAERAEASIARLGLLGGGFAFGDASLQGGKFHLRESSRGEMNVKEVVDSFLDRNRKKKENPSPLVFRSLEIEELEFWLKRNAPRRHDYGIDWADMRLQHLGGHLSDLTIQGPCVTGMIDHLSGEEQSGFQIANLAGSLRVDQGRIALAGLEIMTPSSHLKAPSVDLSGESWGAYKYFIDRVNMELHFEDSNLTTDDVAYFAPSLRDWHLEAEAIALDVSGPVSAISGKLRNLTTSGGSRLRADLAMRGLPDAKRTTFDVKIHSLDTEAQDAGHLAGAILKAPLSKGLVTLLGRAGRMKLSGRFSGLLDDFSAELLAATDAGTIRSEAVMHPDSSGRALQAAATTRRFDLGRLLGTSALGSITLAVATEGSILPKQGPSLWFSSHISELGFNGVEYDSLRLRGTIVGKRYDATLTSESSLLDLTLDADADFSHPVPRYGATLDLRHADLHGMRINERDTLSLLSLRLLADASGSSIEDLKGRVRIRDGRYRYNEQEILSEEVRLEATFDEQAHSLTLNSDFADLSFFSPNNYREAFRQLKLALRSYLPDLYPEGVAESKSEPEQEPSDEYATLTLQVKRLNPITQAIAEGLQVADNSTLSLLHNPLDDHLSLKVKADYVEYNKLFATRLNLSTMSQGDSLILHASASDIYAGMLHMQQLSLTGGAARNRFNLSSEFADSASHLSGRVGMLGRIARNQGTRRLTLHLLPSSISLDEKRWEIFARRVELELDSARIVVDRFSMLNDREALRLDGVASRSREDSIQLTLQHFDLSPLTQLAASLGYRISGTSNGFATVKSALGESQITADINIDSMRVNEKLPVPPLHLISRWDFEQNRAGLFIIDRLEQDTVIRGFYRPSERRYYARARMDSLSAAALDPILKGVISQTEGTARVNLILRGERRDATLEGEILARDLSTTIDYTQVRYRIPEAQIRVVENQLIASDAPVFDPEGNRGELDFTLDLNHLTNISYRLQVTPQEMLVLDTSKEDNDLFYGKIYASGLALIRGDKMGVKMNINASTDDNSVFYMPLSGASNVGKADFVIFEQADRPDTTDYLVRKKMMFERRNRKKREGGGAMDINLGLNVHPNVDLQLVIDPQAGDLLRGRGEGLLNIHVNPRDNIFEMTGDYTLSEGYYLFTLQNIINKKFLIESGSSIQWTGEPMDAMLNINALYKLKTSLQPLLGASTGVDRNANTRTVPVECVIHLGDRLSNPSKSFSIRVPQADSETQTAVANILNTETTIARQFIYLVAFNSFYPESATASSDNIGAVASAATGFELLANQLAKTLSGDDYNIILRYRPKTEMTSDEVDFGFSSNLINNRLFIEVEGNYMLDNKQAVNNRVSNFMGEAYITWLIDRSGNLKLKGFTHTIDRFDETQGLQETGIGIYYKEDFDNLKDLKERIKERFSSEKRRERREKRRRDRAAAATLYGTRSGRDSFEAPEPLEADY